VLRALAATRDEWRYGYELGQEVGLKAGSLYPILIRLTERRLLEARWEDEPPTGRPRRHMYRLTSDGLALADAVATERTVRRPRQGPASQWMAGLRRPQPTPEPRLAPTPTVRQALAADGL
jgi:DNA-binding PadR family transcriptional regulator